jgi:hypothetical protein
MLHRIRTSRRHLKFPGATAGLIVLGMALAAPASAGSPISPGSIPPPLTDPLDALKNAFGPLIDAPGNAWNMATGQNQGQNQGGAGDVVVTGINGETLSGQGVSPSQTTPDPFAGVPTYGPTMVPAGSGGAH